MNVINFKTILALNSGREVIQFLRDKWKLRSTSYHYH